MGWRWSRSSRVHNHLLSRRGPGVYYAARQATAALSGRHTWQGSLSSGDAHKSARGRRALARSPAAPMSVPKERVMVIRPAKSILVLALLAAAGCATYPEHD